MSNLKVRIEGLPPLRVASFHAFSNSPEEDALAAMKAWATAKGLYDLATHRVFGFDTTDTAPGSTKRGYEVWITVGPDVQGDGGAVIKEFGGGLYAVTHCVVRDPWQDIPGTWKKLTQWVEGSAYLMAHHQWLEEHLHEPLDPGVVFTLDLYLPIAQQPIHPSAGGFKPLLV